MALFKGTIYLRAAKSDFRQMHAVLSQTGELYVFESPNDSHHKLMHQLRGTFLRKAPSFSIRFSSEMTMQFHPLAIIIPPDKSRILYLPSETVLNRWVDNLSMVINLRPKLADSYTVISNIGKGQFGLIKLVQHNETGEKYAVKHIQKRNMTGIEVLQT